MKEQQPKLRFARSTVLVAALACIGLPACTTTSTHDSGTSSSKQAEIDSGVNATLTRLYQAAPSSREMIARSAGVLVFPNVLNVGLIVGGEHGDGALRVHGSTVAYYSSTGASVGWQAGAQTKAEVLVFMTKESLDKFRASKGWTAGADATVAVAHIGANGEVDTDTATRPIVGFVLTNSGLMAGVTIEGSKYTQIAM